MRNLVIIAAALLSLTLPSSVAAQDYHRGYRAYSEGDYETALNEWHPLAEQGNASAQTNLGIMYQHGRGVEQNEAEAVRWYLPAAEQGNALAQTNLGIMYERGRGVEQNEAEAVRWYLPAAEQGNATAQSNLGIMYQQGRGVEQNDAEAFRWYLLAAEQGNVLAQAFLGFMYSYGRGVEQNDAQAFLWYLLAAKQGNASAQTNLGIMYQYGRGVEQNEAESARWLRLAAEQGDARAQSMLGLRYQYGRGVERNEAEAVRWLRLAAEQGDARAQRRLLAMMSDGSASSCIDWAKTSPRSEDRLFIDLFENPALGLVSQTFDLDNPPIERARYFGHSFYNPLYDIPKDEFETTAEYLRRRQNFWESAVGAGERSLTIGHQRLRFDYDADGRTMKVSAKSGELNDGDDLPVAIRFSGIEPSVWTREGYYISASNGFFDRLNYRSPRNAREVLITMDATAGREVKSSGFLRLRFRLPIFRSPSLPVALKWDDMKVIHADLDCAVLTTAGGAYYDLLDL